MSGVTKKFLEMMMFKKLFALALASLLLNLVCAAPVMAAGSNPQKEDAKRAAKIKTLIAKVGTGLDADIEVKLLDKTEVKGYVSEAGEDQFVVTDAGTGATTSVKYSQVSKVTLRQPAMKRVLKKELTAKNVARSLLIGTGVAVGVLVLVCAVGSCSQ
jgi:hypothetical protein